MNSRTLFSMLVPVLVSSTAFATDEPPKPASAPAPPRVTSALVVDVKQRGAVGDGMADDTGAIQHALDGGNRTVIIPAGTYQIRHTLKLDSGTTIKADPHAVIRLADNAGNDVGVFLLANRDFAAGATDLTVDGGIWDGNNEHNARGKASEMPCYTGVALNFINVHRLALRNLTVRNPDAYAIRACQIEDFVIEDIGFDFSVTRPNQDGVHLNGFCQRGVIRNLTALSPFATNDDMVALNADDGSGTKYPTQQGMKPGPIHDIRIEHLRAESAFTFVRLLSQQERIENITVSDVVGGCRFYAINMDRWVLPEGGGNIHNVILRDFKIRKMADTVTRLRSPKDRPLILIQSAVHGLRIENFQRASDDVPAATLLLDNGRQNQLRLEGLTTGQEVELRKLTPGVTAEMFADLPDAKGEANRVLQVDAPGKVTLPTGGFAALKLDVAPPKSQ